VYLLHFDRPYFHAQHYLGSTNNLPLRLLLHLRGHSGVHLLRAVRAAGIQWTTARVWFNGGRALEAKFKRAKRNRDLCPICNPAVAEAIGYPTGPDPIIPF
jgi:hypothetical protein